MKCVEINCKNNAKHKGKTNDGFKIRVCDEHKPKWQGAIERAENVWYKRLRRKLRKLRRWRHERNRESSE